MAAISCGTVKTTWKYGTARSSSAVVKPLGTGQRLTLWAVAIAARVVRDALVAAGIALLDVAAERCRATPLNRRHDTTLRCRQRSAVLLTIGVTVAAEHVRHFRRPAGHRGDAQPWSGGFGSAGGDGSGKSSGLAVAQTVAAAICR